MVIFNNQRRINDIDILFLEKIFYLFGSTFFSMPYSEMLPSYYYIFDHNSANFADMNIDHMNGPLMPIKPL